MRTISRVATLIAIAVTSLPKTTRPITTPKATTTTAQYEPSRFESKDARLANLLEVSRFIQRVEHISGRRRSSRLFRSSVRAGPEVVGHGRWAYALGERLGKEQAVAAYRDAESVGAT